MSSIHHYDRIHKKHSYRKLDAQDTKLFNFLMAMLAKSLVNIKISLSDATITRAIINGL